MVEKRDTPDLKRRDKKLLYLYFQYQKEFPGTTKHSLGERLREKVHLTPRYAIRIANELLKNGEIRAQVAKMRHAEDY